MGPCVQQKWREGLKLVFLGNSSSRMELLRVLLSVSHVGATIGSAAMSAGLGPGELNALTMTSTVSW